MPTSSITVTLMALGGWGLRCVPGSSFLHLLTAPATTPRTTHRAGRAAVSHICTTPPERALRNPTQARLARCSCPPPCSRAGGGLQKPVQKGGPLRDSGAPSRRHRAPGALRQAPAPWNDLAPAQPADGRAGAGEARNILDSTPFPGSRKGVGREGEGEGQAAPDSDPVTMPSPLPKEKLNLSPERVSLGKLLPILNGKKQTAGVQRKFQNPISHRWRGQSMKGCHPHVTDRGQRAQSRGELKPYIAAAKPGPSGPLRSRVMASLFICRVGQCKAFMRSHVQGI